MSYELYWSAVFYFKLIKFGKIMEFIGSVKYYEMVNQRKIIKRTTKEERLFFNHLFLMRTA